MAGRPPTYQSADEKPVSVSLRMPRALYARACQYASQRRLTLTELLLDGVQMRLETPTDPRERLLTSDDSTTVMQELQEMVTVTVQAELAKLLSMALPLPTHDIQPTNHDILYDRGNIVLQDTISQQELERHRVMTQATIEAAKDIFKYTTGQAEEPPTVQHQRTPQARTRTGPASRGLPQETLEAIVEARRQAPGLTIRDLAQHLYDKGIYRAKGDKPAEAGWLHRQLVKAREAGLL